MRMTMVMITMMKQKNSVDTRLVWMTNAYDPNT